MNGVTYQTVPSSHPSLANAVGDAMYALYDEDDALERTIACVETESESSAESSAISQHPADFASETFERELDLGLLSDLREQRAEVAEAVHRLHDGSYGVCEDCKQPIDIERLTAVPATRRCLTCQRASERRDSGGDFEAPVKMPTLGEADEFLPCDDDSFDDEWLSIEEQAVHVMRLGWRRCGTTFGVTT